uniref:Uncharacterized protein n=1 Tax=Anopheles culicifacies TaxID=139723 RepID=A0A182MFV1_9DIPT
MTYALIRVHQQGCCYPDHIVPYQFSYTNSPKERTPRYTIIMHFTGGKLAVAKLQRWTEIVNDLAVLELLVERFIAWTLFCSIVAAHFAEQLQLLVRNFDRFLKQNPADMVTKTDQVIPTTVDSDSFPTRCRRIDAGGSRLIPTDRDGFMDSHSR